MENNLKNDFTGTWICRNGKEVKVYLNPEKVHREEETWPFIGDNLLSYDNFGNSLELPDWDLMERISEKDPRR